jgi:hypothetical protein
MDQQIKNREYLIDQLEQALLLVQESAAQEQQISHARHKNTDYSRVIEDLKTLITTEQVMLKRIQTVGR